MTLTRNGPIRNDFNSVETFRMALTVHHNGCCGVEGFVVSPHQLRYDFNHHKWTRWVLDKKVISRRKGQTRFYFSGLTTSYPLTLTITLIRKVASHNG